MAQYEVRYDIQVINAANAAAQINAFATACNKLAGAGTELKNAAKGVTDLKAALAGFRNTKINVTYGQSVKRLNALTAAAKRAEAALLRVQAVQINTGATGVAGGGAKNIAKNAKKTTNQPAAAVGGAKKTSTAPSASKTSKGGGANYRKTGYYPPVMGNVGGTPSIMPGPQRPAFSKAFGGTYKPRAVKQPRSIIPKNASYRMLGPAMIDSGGLGAVSMLKGMGIMYGLTGLGAAIGSGISDYADYNNLITTAKAILGSHDNRPNFEGRFKAMQRLIRDIGMETKFTAPEVADAAKYLAMAGFDIDAINKTMRPITNMALVADSDLGETADVVTNIMTSYQMKPEDMQYVADNLTMAFTMSNTTLMEMAEAYKYFGNLASAFGVDFRETAAMVGLLGDAGLKGSHAGTTIRQIFNNILNPNKKQAGAWKELGLNPRDANGKLRPMMEIFSDLAQKGALEKAFKMFRITASQGAVRLIQDQLNTGKWQRMYNEMLNSEGISDKIAQSRIENLKGQWAQVTSVFRDRVMLAMEAFEPEIKSTMKNLVSWLKSSEGTNFVVKFTNSIFELMKAVGEISKIFLGIYSKMAPFINFWLKWQMILSAILIPLRIVKGLMNFFLGIGMYAMKIGRVTTALTGLRSVLTQGGGWRAAGSSFITTMRGVANSAESASASVVASTYAMPKYYNANGKKTPLGTLRFGLMPSIDNEKIKVRNYLQSRVFAGYGDELRATQRIQNAVLKNNEKMAKVANRSAIGNFLRTGRTKAALLKRYQRFNASNRFWINDYYDLVKPYQDPRLGWGGKLDELKNAYKTLRKVRGTRVEKAVRGQIAKTGAQLRAEIAAYDMSMKEWEKARAMAYGGSAFFGKPGSNQNNGRQTASLWKRITHPKVTQRALRLQRMRNATLGNNSRWGKMKSFFRNNPNTANGLAGAGSMILGGAGAWAGAELGQGDYSAMIWGGLGAMAPMLIASGPVGLAIGAAAVIGGVAYELTQMSKRANEAKEALSHVGDNFRLERGFVAGSEASSMENYYRLMNDSNLSLNERVSLRVKLLEKELNLTKQLAEYNPKEAHEEVSNKYKEIWNQIDEADYSGDQLKTTVEAINLLSNLGLQSLLGNSQGGALYKYGGSIVPSTTTDAGLMLKNMFGQDVAINGRGQVRSAVAALTAGFQDPVTRKEAEELNNKLQEAISSGKWDEIKEIVKRENERIAGLNVGIPDEARLGNKWKFDQPDQLINYGIEKTEPFRMGQRVVLQKALELANSKITSKKLWDAANKSGAYSFSSLQHYFNTLPSFAGIDLMRFKPGGDNSALLDEFHMEANGAFKPIYKTDEYGRSYMAYTAEDTAKMVYAQWENFKKEWDKLKPEQQKAGEEFYKWYKDLAEKAKVFLNGAGNSMIGSMQFTAQPIIEFGEANGRAYMDVWIGGWKQKINSDKLKKSYQDYYRLTGGGHTPGLYDQVGAEYPDRSFNTDKDKSHELPTGKAKPGGRVNIGKNGGKNTGNGRTAAIDQSDYQTPSYWTNGSPTGELSAQRTFNVDVTIQNVNGQLDSDHISGLTAAIKQGVVDSFLDIDNTFFAPVDQTTVG